MFSLFLFVLGAAIGSFLNVLIDRLPKNKRIDGRSRCDYCKKKIAWYDLIPIFSFFILLGKCRFCKKKLSLFYPLVEFLTALVFVVAWNFLGGDWLIKAIKLGLICTLIVIFFADLKYQIIPDSMQILFLIFSLLYIFIEGRNLGYHVLAGLSVGAPILLIYLITKGKGIGFGDVKFSFAMGFLLGLKEGFLALYLAFVLGAVFGGILILLKKKKLKSKIAFGPFMITTALFVFFFGQKVLDGIRKIYY